MKRIIIFCTSSIWGGTEKDALLRAQELKKRNWIVCLVVSGDFLEKSTKRAGIECIRIKRGGDINPFAVLRYYRVIKSFKADVVFLTLVKDYWLGSLASYLNQVKNVFLFLGSERKPKNSLKYRLIHKRLIKGMIVNSFQIKKTFLKYSDFLSDEEIKVIPNGFTAQAINSEQNNRLKKKLNLKNTDILIGTAGRVVKTKAFDLIPKLMEKLDDISNVFIAIAGDGEERGKIEAIVKKKNLTKKIFFLGFQSNLSIFYRGINLFVLFSRREGMANVLNEAMSYGNPVISTRVSGTEELLKDGKMGDIVDIDDIDAIARSIRKYIKDKKCVKDKKYIRHINENYSIKKMIDDTEDFFQKSS